MVEGGMTRYRVTYERDESGWWVASVRGMRGCHTQGRTVDEGRRRIREALALFVDDARRAAIVDDVKLPRVARFGPTRPFAGGPAKRTDALPAQLDARSGYCEPER
jgi:predicted RNase H-like HicB family nuclease